MTSIPFTEKERELLLDCARWIANNSGPGIALHFRGRLAEIEAEAQAPQPDGPGDPQREIAPNDRLMCVAGCDCECHSNGADCGKCNTSRSKIAAALRDQAQRIADSIWKSGDPVPKLQEVEAQEGGPSEDASMHYAMLVAHWQIARELRIQFGLSEGAAGKP